MSVVHSYGTRLSWSGSTAAGYDSYEREHRVRHLVHPAHDHCRVANSLRPEIEVEPEIEVRG